MAADKGVAIAEDLSGLNLENGQFPSSLLQSIPEKREALHTRTPRIIATDITDAFSKATQALRVDELVKDEYFTLFESVGALEIMDPKMDSGYLASGQSLEDEYDVSRSLLPQEVLGIMDQLLGQEMAWHMGSPLSQTLFTSLYLEKLLRLETRALDNARFSAQGYEQEAQDPLLHVILRAYCLALIKCCDFVHRKIGTDYCYEEEDFVTQLYNRNLLTAIREQEVLELIDRALSWLESADVLIEPEEVKAAMIDRFKFRRAFLGALAHDNRPTEHLSSLAWKECLEFLPSITATHKLGKLVPGSFSVKLQRKLASTVPPRPIVELSMHAALAHLERLCQDGADVYAIMDYHGGSDLLTFCWAFQFRKPQPSVYIRALLQSLLFEDNMILGQNSVQNIILNDLVETVLPADILLDKGNKEIEVVHDPRFLMAKIVDEFVTRARQCYLDLYRCICQNRSRIRRTLCHSIYDWDNLQLDAEEIDNELRKYTKEEPVILGDQALGQEEAFAYPLSSWAYLHKLRQMEWIMQLGFELDIYQPAELAGMYWYLQYIEDTRISHLERIRGFVTRKFKGITRVTADVKEAFANSLSFLNFSLLEASACLDFADGLFYLYTALMRLSLIPVPPRPYGTDVLRYELRIKPFIPISVPEVVPFDRFKSMVELEDVSTQGLLENATRSIVQARKNLEQLSKTDPKTGRSRLCAEEWKVNVKNMLRACIAAGIAVMNVKKCVIAEDSGNVKRGARARLELVVAVDMNEAEGKEKGKGKGKGYHDWWVVPRITTSAT